MGLIQQRRIDAEVRAPFAGSVQQRHVAPGAYVQVGQPIVTLVRVDPLRFRGGVPERQALQVQQGQQATIRVEGQSPLRSGRVSRISPALDMSNRALTIEIDVPNPGGRTRVGVFAEADVVVEPAAQTLVIPASAIREFAGIEKAWVVRDGQAEERVLETGRRADGRVEILRGVERGELVVREAHRGRAGNVTAKVVEAAVAERPRGWLPGGDVIGRVRLTRPT